MVFQSSILFNPPSQYRMHMAVDPHGIAYMAVLSPMNQPVSNLHHMTVPFADVMQFAQNPEGTLTAKSEHAWIKIETDEHLPGLELSLTMHDEIDDESHASSIRKGDLLELCQMLSGTTAA